MIEIEKISMSTLLNILNSKLVRDCVIEITNNCTFFCEHCYVENTTKKMMSFDAFKKIIDELVSINCNSILLTGGEPMINPDFIKMYKYAKEKGMFVNINTNGFCLNDQHIRKAFLEYNPDLIEISLYGYNNKTYNNFTHVKNAYDRVISGIEFLVENHINLKLKTTLTKKNCMYLEKLKNIAKNYNLDFRYDYIVFPKINGENSFENKLRLEPETIIQVINKDPEDVRYFKSLVREVLKLKNIDNTINKVFNCGMGKEKIFIDCFGNIRPCLVVPKNYNMSDYSIKAALEEMKKFSNEIKFQNTDYCMKCYKKKLCRYCPGRFYLETGCYDVPSKFYCKLADLLIEEFGNKEN